MSSLTDNISVVNRSLNVFTRPVLEAAQASLNYVGCVKLLNDHETYDAGDEVARRQGGMVKDAENTV